MMSWLIELLNNPAFMPHGHCFLWTPALLKLFILAESMIALSYFAIPLALTFFAWRRPDSPYKPMLWLFGTLITLCGATHLMSLWNIWNSAYWLEAILKLLTGLVSMATVITLYPLIPRALHLPSPGDLATANAALREKIRELQQTQSALVDSEQRYRQLVEAARQGIWMLDQDGNTVFANEHLAKMLGRTPQEMANQPLLDFVESSSRERVREQIEALLNMTPGGAAASPATPEPDGPTIPLQHKDGSILYTIFSGSPVQASGGTTHGILSVVTDITEREKVAQDLSRMTATLQQLVADRTEALKQVNAFLVREIAARAQAQDHLQAVLNAAADGIIVADEHGQILTTNPAVEKIFQYASKETIGQPLSMLMPEPFHQEPERYIRNYLETSQAKIIGIGREVAGLRRDGSEFPLDLAVGVIRNEGSVQFVGIVRDISDRKAAQQQILTLNNQLSQANLELQTKIREREQALRDVDIAHAKLETTLIELRDQSKNTSLLNEMSELLQAAINLQEVGAVIQLYCDRLFGSDAGNLLFMENDKHALVTVFAWGDRTECENQIEHQRCWALRQAKPYPTTALHRSLRCAHLHVNEPRETICLPLFGQGAALGLLALRGGTALGEVAMAQDRRETPAWVLAFIEQVSLAVANIRLHERLHDESMRDPLTGLFNRRYLDQELKRHWSALEQNDQVLALLMIDVDHFKRVNDNYGHDTGDVVLADVAHRLQHAARPGDVLARFGGEEFMMVLPGAGAEVARRRATAICNDMAKNPIRRPNVEDLQITVSIGVVVGRYADDGASVEQMISCADQALYRAKEAGRNRVEVFQ